MAASLVAGQKEARVVAATEEQMEKVTRAQGAEEMELVGVTSEALVVLDIPARGEAVERATARRVMEGVEKVVAVKATVK